MALVFIRVPTAMIAVRNAVITVNTAKVAIYAVGGAGVVNIPSVAMAATETNAAAPSLLPR